MSHDFALNLCTNLAVIPISNHKTFHSLLKFISCIFVSPSSSLSFIILPFISPGSSSQLDFASQATNGFKFSQFKHLPRLRI